MATPWRKIHHHSRKCWRFFWHDNSIWSWLANVIVAFIVIRWVVYPLLGVLLGTSFPIVAVVSESMEHRVDGGNLCGQQLREFRESFDNYWEVCGGWYEEKGIRREQFRSFSFPDGFDKGDVIILWRATRKNLRVGDILIFQGTRPQPIIHRIVDVRDEQERGGQGSVTYQTKGDHNSDSIQGEYGELSIGKERIYGKGTIRVPYLGWLKILFVNAVRPLGINIQR